MTQYITFYSWKGGQARTTSLVNVAFALNRFGHSVFIWDLDLEAPGILEEKIFQPLQEKCEGGTVDILAAPDADLEGQIARLVLDYQDADQPNLRMRILAAGVASTDYLRAYARVDWADLFNTTKGSELMERMRQAIERTYRPDFVLIDARTGITDIGAISTLQLADTVVLVYTLAEQAIQGTHRIQAKLGAIGRDKTFRPEPMRILRLATLVPNEPREVVEETLARIKRMGLEPNWLIPLEPSLFVRNQIFTRDFPDDRAISRPYVELALALAPTQTKEATKAPMRERERNEPTFADRVAGVLQLMQFETTASDQPGADWLAREKGRFRDSWYAVACHEGPRPADIDHALQLSRALAALQAQHPGATGLLVSAAGFTPAASAEAPSHKIEAQTYTELVDRLVDFGGYNQTLIDDVRGQEIERLYIPRQAQPEQGESTPLDELVDRFLGSPGDAFLTVLGNFGTGKTWFTRKLAHDLAVRWERDPVHNRRPILINLRLVAKALDLEGILYHHLQRDAKAVLQMQREGRLVMIFDGFDEMATQSDLRVTVENFRQLARAAEGLGKVILTSRTHYFKQLGEAAEVAHGALLGAPLGTALYDEARKVRGFQMATLPVFTWEQTVEYLDRACGEKAAEVLAMIERQHAMKEVATHPQLLDMVVKSAPRLALADRFDVATLYETAVREWLERTDFRSMFNQTQRETLVEEMAVRLWETDTAQVHYSELNETLKALFPERIRTEQDLDFAGTEVRTATFLVWHSQVGHYGFSHRSFLEFFLARHLKRHLVHEDFAARLALRPLSPPVVEFLCDLAGAAKVAETAERVLTAGYVARGSENALMLWRRCGAGPTATPMRLEGAHLEGRDLSGMDLTGARLDGADLTLANLAGARLGGASLRDSKLGAAVLEGASVGGADVTGADMRFARMWRAEGALVGWDKAMVFGAPREPRPPARVAPVPAAAPCRGVAFSPDSTLAAVAIGNIVAIADAVSGAWRMTLQGHSRAVASVSFNHDGSLLASASDDKSVRIWDPLSGKLLRSLDGHSDSVLSVSFSNDSSLLASASSDNSVRIWDPRSGKLLRSLDGHSDSVWSVSFSNDSSLLASASHDKSVRIWDPHSGKLLRSLDGHSDSVRSVSFSSDGVFLASASNDRSVRIWDPRSGKLLRFLDGHSAAVLSVSFSSDGSFLASASVDRSIRIWDPRSGKLLRSLDGHSAAAESVSFSSDGSFLASASDDKSVRIWDPRSGKLLRSLGGHSAAVRSVSFSSDGAFLASADDNSVRIWDPRSGKLLRFLGGSSDWVSSVSFSRDGAFLASASSGNSVRIWDPRSGKLLRSLDGHSAAVRSVSFSNDSSLLASASDDKSVRIWDPHSGKLLRSLDGHSDSVSSVSFSNDSSLLASASLDKSVRIWDPRSGKLLRSLDGHSSYVVSVSFSNDSSLLASASDDKSVRIWDPRSGKLLRSLDGHSAAVLSVSFGITRDSSLLASASLDKSVRIWDPATGKCLAVIRADRSGWITTVEDADGFVNHWMASEEGRERIRFVHDWGLFPLEAYAALENPEAIRRSLGGGG